MKMTKMRWIKGPTKNSYFRDGINPGPCVVLNKEVMTIQRRQKAQKILVGQKVRERFRNTKSWWNFTPKLWVRLQAKF